MPAESDGNTIEEQVTPTQCVTAATAATATLLPLLFSHCYHCIFFSVSSLSLYSAESDGNTIEEQVTLTLMCNRSP